MIKGGKWLQQLDKRHSVLGHRVLGGCWWPLQIHARSNRNAGRHHRGFAGDFPRNPQASFSVARIVKCSPKTLRKRYRDDLDFGVAEANAIVSGSLFAAANVVAQIFWLKTRAQWWERAAPGDRAAGGARSLSLVAARFRHTPLRWSNYRWFLRRPVIGDAGACSAERHQSRRLSEGLLKKLLSAPVSARRRSFSDRR